MKTNTLYSKLLSPSRLRASSVSNRPIIAEAESDRGRLLFCPAFRRLQQKAQVFSMEPNAAVRSRLTHSFEVSQMGRYIADTLGPKLTTAGHATAAECSAMVTFVETACLMHDIGNPPFGHFGETAISQWFRANGADVIKEACNSNAGMKKELTDFEAQSALADFFEFDGNPQGLRVVTKLQRNSDNYGLNLTKTSLAAFLKYIRCTGEGTDEGNPAFTKKAGFFKTELQLVRDVWNQFGYDKSQRFPLAYVMEAADDLAYCVSDLEDSIEKGLLKRKMALADIYDQWRGEYPKAPDQTYIEIDKILHAAMEEKTVDGRPFTYTDFRTALNREIVAYCADQYMLHHDCVLLGTAMPLLEPSSAGGTILRLLREYCRTHVYSHESVQRVELAGYAAIYGLLESFSCLLKASYGRFTLALEGAANKDESGRSIVLEKKLLTLLPKNYLAVYRDDLISLTPEDDEFASLEWNLRAHLLTDFISGMTDDFAMTTYRTLSGMRL